VRKVVGALAVFSLAVHLAYLPPTLEDSDSVNFALGVRDFDVARHQPHPPGYPVYIALAKLSTSALSMAGVAVPDVRGLAIWSAVAAGALPWLLFVFFATLPGDGNTRRAMIASVLTACSPLVWFAGVRPLSDLAGLAAACGALAALGSGLVFHEKQALTPKGSATWLVLGAFLAGVAVGFRVQMALLTLPLVAVALLTVPRRRVAVLAALTFGVAVWAVPLILLSGGPEGYLRALGSQAGEDLTGVVMLWTHPTPRVAFSAFIHTFVRPWDSAVLAGVVLALSAGGLLTLAWRAPKALALLLITFAPYALFHLLFQEPLTLRYALPLIPVIAYLAAGVIAEADRRASTVTVVGLAAASLACGIPATRAFASGPSPIFGLLSEARMIGQRGAEPVVVMHRRVFTESRRARIYAGDVPGRLLPAPRDYEWLEATRAWREGHDGETWFLADPRRTDLALIDREHARTREYRWPFDKAIYVGGGRPDEIDWHVVTDPGWFLEQGWALTPEVAGIADRDGWGPHRRPSVGWVRRRTSATLMMIGGRHLGGDPPVTVAVSVDDRPATSFAVRPGFFLNFVELPAGTFAGADRYAKLTVSASAVGGGAVPPTAIEQFNLQNPETLQFGFDDGWYEPEYNTTTSRSWRWMSERAVIRVHAPHRGVVVQLRGESPLRYFDRAPLIRISAGDRVISELRPSTDFTADISVPADALAAAGGRIVVTSDLAFVPGERGGTADRRRLALRVYSVAVTELPR
jgi:hypothetical protein